MIPMKIVGVQLERVSGSPVVLLREEGSGERVLPIFIGAPEARAIILALEGVERPRPATHDLLADVLEAVGARLTRVEVTELRSGTFMAELAFSADSGEHRVSSRPSDAIALALRVEAPIFVHQSVLEEAGVEVEEAEPGSLDDEEIDAVVEEFQELLQTLSPEDFEGEAGNGEPPSGDAETD